MCLEGTEAVVAVFIVAEKIFPLGAEGTGNGDGIAILAGLIPVKVTIGTGKDIVNVTGCTTVTVPTAAIVTFAAKHALVDFIVNVVIGRKRWGNAGGTIPK